MTIIWVETVPLNQTISKSGSNPQRQKHAPLEAGVAGWVDSSLVAFVGVGGWLNAGSSSRTDIGQRMHPDNENEKQFESYVKLSMDGYL